MTRRTYLLLSELLEPLSRFLRSRSRPRSLRFLSLSLSVTGDAIFSRIFNRFLGVRCLFSVLPAKVCNGRGSEWC